MTKRIYRTADRFAKAGKNLRTVLLAAVLLVLAVSVGHADNLRHPELQKFEKEGGRVEFIGNAYGLDGWLLTRHDLQPRTAYTTVQGGLVLGQLVNPAGAVETVDQLVSLRSRLEGSQAALPGAEKTAASKAERFYAEIEQAHWVRIGDENAPYLYMFMNVNCDHCQAYWKELQPMIDAGRLQVRLAPFGAYPANREGGAALLSVENPGAAWLEYIDGKKESLSRDKASDTAFKAIDANTLLLKKWNVQGVPLTVYRRLTDGVLTAIVERPKNMMVVLADLMR